MSVTALTHSWNILRGLQTNNHYSDLSLTTVDGETINCHKVVLSSVSNKVKIALEKRDTNKLVIRNITYGGMSNVIQFIYQGRVELSNSEELMDFADTYTILQLNMGPKIAKMIENITLSNSNSEGNSSQEQEFKCENCKKVFPTKKTLTRHVRQVHDKVEAKAKVKQAFSCESCGELYTVFIS